MKKVMILFALTILGAYSAQVHAEGMMHAVVHFPVSVWNGYKKRCKRLRPLRRYRNFVRIASMPPCCIFPKKWLRTSKEYLRHQFGLHVNINF